MMMNSDSGHGSSQLDSHLPKSSRICTQPGGCTEKPLPIVAGLVFVAAPLAVGVLMITGIIISNF